MIIPVGTWFLLQMNTYFTVDGFAFRSKIMARSPSVDKLVLPTDSRQLGYVFKSHVTDLLAL